MEPHKTSEQDLCQLDVRPEQGSGTGILRNMGKRDLVVQSSIIWWQCCHLHPESSRRPEKQGREGTGVGSRQS